MEKVQSVKKESSGTHSGCSKTEEIVDFGELMDQEVKVEFDSKDFKSVTGVEIAGDDSRELPECIQLTEERLVEHNEVRSESDERWSDQELKDPLAIKEDISWRMKDVKMCQQCGYTTETEAEMGLHLKKSHGEPKPMADWSLRCEHCDFSTHFKSLLTRHMKRHSKKQPHQCPQCDYFCVHLGDLKKHIQGKHTLDRPHQCSLCDFCCIQLSDLKYHVQRKHTMEQPYLCPYCDYCCVKANSLKIHVQTKHTMELPHQCPQCDYSCANVSGLKKHIDNRHTLERPHQCPKCDYCCIQSGDLKKHLKRKHKSEPPS